MIWKTSNTVHCFKDSTSLRILWVLIKCALTHPPFTSIPFCDFRAHFCQPGLIWVSIIDWSTWRDIYQREPLAKALMSLPESYFEECHVLCSKCRFKLHRSLKELGASCHSARMADWKVKRSDCKESNKCRSSAQWDKHRTNATWHHIVASSSNCCWRIACKSNAITCSLPRNRLMTSCSWDLRKVASGNVWRKLGILLIGSEYNGWNGLKDSLLSSFFASSPISREGHPLESGSCHSQTPGFHCHVPTTKTASATLPAYHLSSLTGKRASSSARDRMCQ